MPTTHAKPPQRTQPKTNAGGTREGQTQRGAPNGCDAEGARHCCLGRGQRQAPRARLWAGLRCPAQAPSKSGSPSPRDGNRHHGVVKAARSTETDQTGRGAGQHAWARGTPGRHAAVHNQNTRTGAKQQRPPGAGNQGSTDNTQRTTALEKVPDNTQATHHKPQQGEAGYRRSAHTNTYTPTPQPGMADRSQKQNPRTHTYTAHASQDWRGTSRARTQIQAPQHHSQDRRRESQISN